MLELGTNLTLPNLAACALSMIWHYLSFIDGSWPHGCSFLCTRPYVSPSWCLSYTNCSDYTLCRLIDRTIKKKISIKSKAFTYNKKMFPLSWYNMIFPKKSPRWKRNINFHVFYCLQVCCHDHRSQHIFYPIQQLSILIHDSRNWKAVVSYCNLIILLRSVHH